MGRAAPNRIIDTLCLFLLLAAPHHAWAVNADLTVVGSQIGLYVPLLFMGILAGYALGLHERDRRFPNGSTGVLLTVPEVLLTFLSLCFDVCCVASPGLLSPAFYGTVSLFDLILPVFACVAASYGLACARESGDERLGSAERIQWPRLSCIVLCASLLIYGWTLFCIDGLVLEVVVFRRAAILLAQAVLAALSCLFVLSGALRSPQVLAAVAWGVVFGYCLGEAMGLYACPSFVRCVLPFASCAAFAALFFAARRRDGSQDVESPAKTSVLAGRCIGAPDLPTRLAVGLTEKERAIVGFSVKGESSAQIAKRLGVKPSTVRGNLQRIYRKLNIGGLDELRSLGDGERGRAEDEPTMAEAIPTCRRTCMASAFGIACAVCVLYLLWLSPVGLGTLPNGRDCIGFGLGIAGFPLLRLCPEVVGGRNTRACLTSIAALLLASVFLLMGGVLKRALGGVADVPIYDVLALLASIALSCSVAAVVSFCLAVLEGASRRSGRWFVGSLAAGSALGFVGNLGNVPCAVCAGVASLLACSSVLYLMRRPSAPRFEASGFARSSMWSRPAGALTAFVLGAALASIPLGGGLIPSQAPALAIVAAVCAGPIAGPNHAEHPRGDFSQLFVGLALSFALGVLVRCFFGRFDLLVMAIYGEALPLNLWETGHLLCGLAFDGLAFCLACSHLCTSFRRLSEPSGEASQRRLLYLQGRGLSEKDALILSEVSRGYTGPQVARRLAYSLGSVNAAKAVGYRLLGIHSSRELSNLLNRDVPAR